MKRPPTYASGSNAYLGFRRSAGRFVETLEYLSGLFFGESSNPFSHLGAILLGLIIISAVTGAYMLLHYTPTPDLASSSINRLTTDVRFGSLVRAIHRASADIIILVLLLHAIRNWATGRYSGPRRRSWLTGLLALPLIGIIGWAGYVLPWDERAMVLLSWGRELWHGADKWPILGWFNLGSLVSWPVFGASNEADQLLRIFALHLGGALATIGLVICHLRRVTPPRAKLPIAVWVGLLLVLLLIAAAVPFEMEELRSFNPFAVPTHVRVDLIVLFPLLFYPVFGGPLLGAIIVVILIALALLPRMEPKPIPTAVVSQVSCTGCRLCYNDCPYGAIEMIPHPDPASRNKGREIARVFSSFCNPCGICVGSCAFNAIELPTMTSDEIVAKIERAIHIDDLYTPRIPPEEGGS